jgi:predicted CoA-binding protein
VANPSDDELRRIYAETETIAVVGASNDEAKDAHKIPRYLQQHGFRIIPVNPRGGEILGERAYASLTDVDVPVDVVDVFRPSEETPGIAEDAVAIGAKVLWLQLGIESEDAARIAREGGLTAVMDLCIGVTHRRLGLGPGPHAA